LNTAMLILERCGNATLGFSLGYVIASLVESYMHQHVSDAPNKSVLRWQVYPRLFGYLIRTRYSHHVIHHCRTFKKNFVTQFQDDGEHQRLDEYLAKKGAHGKIIKSSNYAVKLHGSGALVFIAPLLPAIPLLFYFFNEWVVAGACMALMLPPLLSNYVHPYLHVRHCDAICNAPPIVSWLLKTRYFRAMTRNHYMHHRYVAGNYNLLLGGDHLRGTYRCPTQQDRDAMQHLGIPLN